MAVQGIYRFRDIATLTRMRAEWDACLSAIANASQSYSIAGRSFTRANLAEVQNVVAEIDWAIGLKTGSMVRTVYSDFSNS